jgi:predicted dithiol-disulfide oxidoreductase (DUF899 family)
MESNFGREWWAQCSGCAASHGVLEGNERDAKARWNARAALRAPKVEAPSLHAQIMNLPMRLDDRDSGAYANGYKHGFKDARHAAAELALSHPLPALAPLQVDNKPQG